MITEDYVSFETAKLLKEKGFDEQCYAYYNIFYDNDGKELKLWRKYPHRAQPNSDYLNVPTIQTAMKWLREVHNLHCDIGYDDLDWFWNIISVSNDIPVEDRPNYLKNGFAGIATYEQACEKAIKYCLENLLKKNDEDKHMKKPFFIITNTKTGKCFHAEKCHADLVGRTFAITTQNIDDAALVVGKPCFNDVMTKKERIGDNTEIHVEIFNKDKIKQDEYFLYNAWIIGTDSEKNEIVLSCDWAE